MGVTGLWKLIEPCGKPVPVETLDGKVLAIDISIWLHQVVKGFQDNKGSALANSHLLGLFHRLCKLLYYRVKPVFVFDGQTPQLKIDTIARRQQQRSKLNNEADRVQALLLQTLAKEKVVQQALGANATELLLKSSSSIKGTKGVRSENTVDDMFKLPELPSSSNADELKSNNRDEDSDYGDSSFASADYASTSATDSSMDESNPRHAYNNNLQAIDVRSNEFRVLPADIRHEILVDIKETRKQSSWGRLHELPPRSDDFSSFQMKRLLKRRAVQESLEQAEEEMGGRTITYSELKNMFTEEGIVEPKKIEKGMLPICSDENTRFLLVRNLKKKLAKIEEINLDESSVSAKLDAKIDVHENNGNKITPKPSASQSVVPEETFKSEQNNTADNEFDADLELAIALSLENSNVYREKDYDFDSGESLKLNSDQRKHLKNAAIGPARAYMIEYAGMNEDEVENIMDKTQVALDNILKELGASAIEGAVHVDNKKKLNSGETEGFATKTKENLNKNESVCTLVTNISDTDSDLEEVPNVQAIDERSPKVVGSNETKELDIKEKEVVSQVEKVQDESDTDSDLEEVPNEQSTLQNANAFEIVLDLKEKLPIQDDLFADVFEKSPATESIAKNEIKNDKEIRNAPKEDEKVNLHLTEIKMSPTISKKPENVEILSILDELKRQAEDVKKIDLNDIKIDKSLIDLTGEETVGDKRICTKSEIIEIYDNKQSSQLLVNNSPKLRTPSKSKGISDYFDTNYVIKRTPEKPIEEVAKVKSPFFVNKTKTPKSNSKSVSEHNSPTHHTKNVSKAAKSLFPEQTTIDANEPVNVAKLTTQDYINEAARTLKEQNSEQELEALAFGLAKETTELEKERNRQERMGMSISQRMNAECQELLRLFGIPFIVAPMEAEAQCAFLDYMELTNGTITDDSDIWLFGGRTVYKNFFAQNKHVLEFRADSIQKSFSCDREMLIQLACLVGSDYTTGVHGIGAVTALEILAAFSTVRDSMHKKDNANQANIIPALSTLGKFRDWWQASKNSPNAPPGNSARMALLKKLKNIVLHDGFPSSAVIEAYLKPKVDENKDSFSWGYPDVESIREFSKKTFGWTTSKTDDILMPVMKKINEKKSQASIRNYFGVKSALTLRQLQVSKRVQNAIDKISGKTDAETTEAVPKTKTSKRTKRKKAADETNDKDVKEVNLEDAEKPCTSKRTKRKKATAETKADVANDEDVQDVKDLEDTKEPCSSSQISAKCTKRVVNIPSTKETIPQREQDLKQMRKNKERAAEIFKSSDVAAKKKRKK